MTLLIIVLLVGCQPKGPVDPNTLPDQITWPITQLPEPNAVLDKLVSDTSEQIVVNVTNMRQQDIDNYAKQLIDNGYLGGLNNTTGDTVLVGGTHQDGSAVMFVYIKEANAGTITYYPKP